MREYSKFVQTVRKWRKRDTVNGFQKAIEECIANDILREYLERKTREVINMLIGEYDYEMDIAVQRAEEREIAFAEGIERGKSLGLTEGKSLGLTEGAYQKALEMAKLLKRFGDSVQKIIQVTGLSESEIEAL